MRNGLIALAIGWTSAAAAQDRPPCREVGDLPHLVIDPEATAQLAEIGLDRTELFRLWPAGPITPRKLRWAIDTRVQQRTLPGDEGAARLRRKLAALPAAERSARLKAMLAWYQGLSEAIDQDGVSRDMPGTSSNGPA